MAYGSRSPSGRALCLAGERRRRAAGSSSALGLDRRAVAVERGTGTLAPSAAFQGVDRQVDIEVAAVDPRKAGLRSLGGRAGRVAGWPPPTSAPPCRRAGMALAVFVAHVGGIVTRVAAVLACERRLAAVDVLLSVSSIARLRVAAAQREAVMSPPPAPAGGGPAREGGPAAANTASKKSLKSASQPVPKSRSGTSPRRKKLGATTGLHPPRPRNPNSAPMTYWSRGHVGSSRVVLQRASRGRG